MRLSQGVAVKPWTMVPDVRVRELAACVEPAATALAGAPRGVSAVVLLHEAGEPPQLSHHVSVLALASLACGFSFDASDGGGARLGYGHRGAALAAAQMEEADADGGADAVGDIEDMLARADARSFNFDFDSDDDNESITGGATLDSCGGATDGVVGGASASEQAGTRRRRARLRDTLWAADITIDVLVRGRPVKLVVTESAIAVLTLGGEVLMCPRGQGETHSTALSRRGLQAAFDVRDAMDVPVAPNAQFVS